MNVRVFRAAASLILVFGIIPVCSAEETPAQVVVRLYRDFSWEAVIEEPTSAAQTLVDQPKAVLQHYLNDNLTALILEDRECVRRTHEICRLDFVPIWASQDPAGASDLRVSASAKTPSIVRVRFRYPNGQVLTLTYHMVMTPRGWRVADVEYPTGPTLVAVLTGRP